MRRIFPAILLLCSLVSPRPANAYSLLTHEELIDLTWGSAIVPLLLSRYPTLTPAQLEHARAYAYGGCVIQDIGYYPFGDAFFSDLTHYVRSGDFVVNLFRNAGNADELAFAIGALSHYIGDTIGHSEATNLSVPIEFPKLEARYGKTVSYAEGEHQHVQVEFAYDIDQIAHHRLAPVHYLRHVGLSVPTRQVSLAFYQTYGLREDFSAHRAARINVGGYRFSVQKFIPRIAYALTLLHRKHEPADIPSPELQRLQAAVDQMARENHWDEYRKKPGIGTYSLAGLILILPKIGPLKLVAVKGPSPQTESSTSTPFLTPSTPSITPSAASPRPHPSAPRQTKPPPLRDKAGQTSTPPDPRPSPSAPAASPPQRSSTPSTPSPTATSTPANTSNPPATASRTKPTPPSSIASASPPRPPSRPESSRTSPATTPTPISPSPPKKIPPAGPSSRLTSSPSNPSPPAPR